MDLSVVIPTRDKASLLARTLAALAAQDVPGAQWEVVVVDDASGDGTAGLLDGLVAEWGGRLIRERPLANVGRARARNIGARRAGGRWLLFLDDDILAPPGLLAAHLETVAGRQRVGTIGLVRTLPEIVDAPHFHYIDTRGGAKIDGGLVPARYFVTQNAMVPREDFLAVGGFDEDFSAYGFEDMEVAFRLADERGLRFLPVRSPVPHHAHHHTLHQWLAKKIEVGSGSLRLMARRHPGRIREMRLDLVMGSAFGHPVAMAVRLLARRLCLRLLEMTARGWPVRAGHVPRCAAAHHRLLDLMVLVCYRIGYQSDMNGGAD